MVVLEDDRSFATNDCGCVALENENKDPTEVVSDEEEEKKDQGTANVSMTNKRMGGDKKQGVVFSFATGVYVLSCVALLVLLFIFTNHTPDLVSPKSDLQTFVVSTKSDLSGEFSSIEDIKTESYRGYAAAYCLEGTTLERARDALRVGLRDVPEAVRNDIAERALQEGITAKNTWRDSSADLVNTNKAHSYMAFYSTTFEPGRSIGKDVYKTCVMVAGVTFIVAEQIVDYEEKEEDVQIGTRVECKGWFIAECYKVPVLGKRKSKIPILRRNALSLKEQKDLHNWMVHQAIDSAGNLIGAGLSTLDNGLSTNNALPDDNAGDSAWKWKPPNYAAEL